MPDLDLRAENAPPASAPVTAETDLPWPGGRIPLTRVPRALIAHGFTSRPIPYLWLYKAAVSGAIPAEQVTTNRWSVHPDDLPAVATGLGLLPPTPAQPPEVRAPRAAASVAA